MRVEKIAWLDAVSEDQWIPRGDITPHHHTCVSLGFLVDESDTVVTLALNHDLTSGNLSCIMHIPKVMILERKVISI